MFKPLFACLAGECNIQCRFAAGSTNLRELGRYMRTRELSSFQPNFNVQEIDHDESAQHIQIDTQIIQDTIDKGKFNLEPFVIRLNSETSVVSINLHLVKIVKYSLPIDQKHYPISGFPRPLYDRTSVNVATVPSLSKTELQFEEGQSISKTVSTVQQAPVPLASVKTQPIYDEVVTNLNPSLVGTGQSDTLVGEDVSRYAGTTSAFGEQTTLAGFKGMDNQDQDDLLDVSSISSHGTTVQEKDAKSHIANFLATDKDIRDICASLLEQTDRTKFAEVGRKLLKSFYLRLQEDADTELEKQSVRLLKSRRGRVRIVEEMADLISPVNAETGKKMEHHEDDLLEALRIEERKKAVEQNRLKRLRLEGWTRAYSHKADHTELEPAEEEEEEAKEALLTKTQGETTWNEASVVDQGVHEAELIPRNQAGDEILHDVNVTHHQWTAKDIGWSSEDEEDVLPNLTHLESFFRNSEAFQVLLNGFREMLLSQSLKDVLLSASVDQIRLSSDQGESLVNRFKAFVEDTTKLEWDWWPLEQRMRPLQRNQSCGEQLWREILRNEAKIIEPMLEDRPTMSFTEARCKRYQSWTSWAKGSNGSDHLLPVSNVPSGKSSLSGTAQSPQGTSTGLTTPSTPSQPGPSVGAQPYTSIVRPNTPPSSSWVIFGVQGPRPRLEAGEIVVNDKMDDSTFYRNLKKHYQKSWGRFRLWLSFWRLGYCEVVKFKYYAPDIIIRHHSDLPVDLEYKYKPRPPASDAFNPPISSHEFAMHFNACDEPCRWKSLPRHFCMPQLHGTITVDRVPKKSSPFD
ncbi:hypothetical protein C7974DRAFT_472211, partial [Boeremia exigua]|uniref:uncharacterized protein n=1 Tax=Boeremia exigua TaxID=749465 RepID=UPI001E8CF21F